MDACKCVRLIGIKQIMNVEQAHKVWTKLGDDDAMWQVLSWDDKQGGKWTPEEFFATGRQEMDRALQTIQEAGVTLNRGAALDFGCGLGRLSQALAQHFQKVVGVDVSGSMISQANAYNKHPSKVEYLLNVNNHLALLPRNQFDFIYSNIVLQHIPPGDQLRYIGEFMDLLRVGGVAYFQTIHWLRWRAWFPDWFVEVYRRLKHRGTAYTPMYGTSISKAEIVIRKGGGRIERRTSEPCRLWGNRFAIDFYLAVKTPRQQGSPM
jgi:2-polyprenyl-3-methyl-5-hydroxy-6-metoxy-1,4-benzoquinol methylase